MLLVTDRKVLLIWTRILLSDVIMGVESKHLGERSHENGGTDSLPLMSLRLARSAGKCLHKTPPKSLDIVLPIPTLPRINRAVICKHCYETLSRYFKTNGTLI